jgi:hypothetical protein
VWSQQRWQTARPARAGEELAAFQLPAPLRCLAVDPGEHALYAGGGDGCVYEVSLLQGGGGGAGVSGASGGTSRHVALEGHAAAVTALALTTDGLQLVSGVVAYWPVQMAARCQADGSLCDSCGGCCSVQQHSWLQSAETFRCSTHTQLQQKLRTSPVPVLSR